VSERFYEQPGGDRRRSAPAAARNVEPIIAVLEQWLPAHGTILELASGTGEHAIAFARHFPHLEWQPSDPNPDALQSIEAWREAAGGDNLAPPMD
jgi:methylase of polypeptide subunit release factors